MTKQITLTYCGMQATGPTVKDAKQDATRKIESLLDQLSAPEVVPMQINHRQYVTIVYRTVYGWGYSIVTEDTPRNKPAYGSEGYQSRDAAYKAMRMHLAQYAFVIPDPDKGIAGFSGLDLPATVNDANDHRRWVQWQCRYAYAARNGTTDPRDFADRYQIESKYYPADCQFA